MPVMYVHLDNNLKVNFYILKMVIELPSNLPANALAFYIDSPDSFWAFILNKNCHFLEINVKLIDKRKHKYIIT